MSQFAIGLDFGTSSARCLVVDVGTGREVATAVAAYPSGQEGVLLSDSDVHLARQRPADHFDSLVACTREALAQADADPEFSRDRIVGIGVDTTGSSPMPLAEDGSPLGMKPGWDENLAAQCWLWKDHTGAAEAEEITAKAAEMGRPFLDKCGGTYSSEWFWSKILKCARVAPEVMEAAHSWGEMQDVIPAWLTGTFGPEMKRGICAAGHKAMYHQDWGGLPDREFLAALDPRLAELRDRLYSATETADRPAGRLTPERADQLGLPAGIVVAVGAFDAHMGAVGAGVQPGTIVKIMGTSTCEIMVGGAETPDIPGVCGVVPGSVIPGMIGIEAGQSAVGDLFGWAARELDGRPDAHIRLQEEAARLAPGESGLLALDWNNGNRTILVDTRLTGLLVGQTLQTTAADIYRAMIEATAFGSRVIIEQIEAHGVKIEQVVACGGIAEKSDLTMQIYADILNRPIRLSRSGQTCALGAAMFGAVAGGAHPGIAAATQAMTGFKDRQATPDPAAVAVYDRLYRLYRDLHDAFGRTGRTPDLSGLMKQLLAIQKEASR
ncbi:MAG: ribulokinase [Fimbriimonadaceae bacterium]|nr:ribulokinase [Fimbriimonadaceae bacterium]